MTPPKRTDSEDTTPFRFSVPGLRCADGKMTGRFMLREARPMSAPRTWRRGIWLESLPEALRDAPSVLLSVIDEAAESWILLASAAVLNAAVDMEGDIRAFPGAFYLLCRESTWKSLSAVSPATSRTTCQNGHSFEVKIAAPLPPSCPTCGAPAQPARPFAEPPKPGPYGERAYVRAIS